MADKDNTGENGKRILGMTRNRPYWVLGLSIVIRAAHQVGAAIFLAAYLLDEIQVFPQIYTLLAVVSGVALVFTEWLRHRQLFREFGGMVTLSKCVLLGAAMHGLLPVKPLVLIIFVVASMAAHAPKNVRHRLLF